MQKRKEHTEMEILSIPTAENQEEFITLPLYTTGAQYFGSRMTGSGAGRTLVWRVGEEQGHITMTTLRVVAMKPHWCLHILYLSTEKDNFDRFIKRKALYLLLLKRSIFVTTCLTHLWAQKLKSKQRAFSSHLGGIKQQTNWKPRSKNWTASPKTVTILFLIFASIFAFFISKTNMQSTLTI